MPRYFFDLHQGHLACDEAGTEFPDLEAAIANAKRTAAGVGTDLLREEGDVQSLAVVVRDESGVPVYSGTLAFRGTRL